MATEIDTSDMVIVQSATGHEIETENASAHNIVAPSSLNDAEGERRSPNPSKFRARRYPEDESDNQDELGVSQQASGTPVFTSGTSTSTLAPDSWLMYMDTRAWEDDGGGIQVTRAQRKKFDKQNKESGLRQRRNKKSPAVTTDADFDIHTDTRTKDWLTILKHYEEIAHELRLVGDSIRSLVTKCEIEIDPHISENPLGIIPIYGPKIILWWLRKIDRMRKIFYSMDMITQFTYQDEDVLRDFGETLPSIFMYSCKIQVLVNAADLPAPGMTGMDSKLHAALNLRRMLEVHRVTATLKSMSDSGEQVLGWLRLAESQRMILDTFGRATVPNYSDERQPLIAGNPTTAFAYSEYEDQHIFNNIPSMPYFSPHSTAQISKLKVFLHDQNTLWLIVLLFSIISAFFSGTAFLNDSPIYTPLSQLFRLYASLWCMLIPLFRDRTLPIWPAKGWLYGSAGLSAALCILAVGLCKTDKD